MRTWPDIPGISVARLPEPGPGLAISIEEPDLAARLSPDIRRDVDAAWATLKRGNPRLFDGPMLTVLDYDVSAAHIRCARATYRYLAAAGWVQTGARMLGVNGILTGRDARGIQHALLARRGETTRVYPGMWEFAPAGGIDHGLSDQANQRAGAHFRVDAVRAALIAEGEEELGVALGGRAMRAVAICEDIHAPSVDVIVQIDIGDIDPANPPHRESCWEYSETRWLPLTNLPTFPSLSLMTQALIRFLWP